MCVCVRACACWQTLQEKVCEIQARLHSEERSRQLQLQRLQQSHEQSVLENTSIIRTLQEELLSTQPSGEGSCTGRGDATLAGQETRETVVLKAIRVLINDAAVMLH